jgi:hypothetical protein
VRRDNVLCVCVCFEISVLSAWIALIGLC